VQNLTPLALSSAEKSVTVQRNIQTVTDISTPCLSACVDKEVNAVQGQTVWKVGLSSPESALSRKLMKKGTRSSTALNCLIEPCRTLTESKNGCDEMRSGLRCTSVEQHGVLSATRTLKTPML